MGKKSLLPSFDVIFIGVFFAFFLMWMVPRCMETKSKLQEETDGVQAQIDSLDKVMDSLLIKPKVVNVIPDSTKITAAGVTQSANSTTAILPKKTITSLTPAELPGKLYITINNLKLRKGPHLDSTVLATLPIDEAVFFLDEVTEFTQQISLGYEIADEPWVKVRTKNGFDGWVYGAGVHYYKKKREGVMD